MQDCSVRVADLEVIVENYCSFVSQLRTWFDIFRLKAIATWSEDWNKLHSETFT